MVETCAELMTLTAKATNWQLLTGRGHGRENHVEIYLEHLRGHYGWKDAVQEHRAREVNNTEKQLISNSRRSMIIWN